MMVVWFAHLVQATAANVNGLLTGASLVTMKLIELLIELSTNAYAM